MVQGAALVFFCSLVAALVEKVTGYKRLNFLLVTEVPSDSSFASGLDEARQSDFIS